MSEKDDLCNFIDAKMADIEKAIKLREELRRAWVGGTDKSWKAVGCKLTQSQRLSVAERESRILIKLRSELDSFTRIYAILTDGKTE